MLLMTTLICRHYCKCHKKKPQNAHQKVILITAISIDFLGFFKGEPQSKMNRKIKCRRYLKTNYLEDR